MDDDDLCPLPFDEVDEALVEAVAWRIRRADRTSPNAPLLAHREGGETSGDVTDRARRLARVAIATILVASGWRLQKTSEETT